MSDDFTDQIEFDERGIATEKPDRKIWTIVLVVLLVLLCCCVILVAGGWFLWTNGDQWFGFATSVFNLLV